MNNRLLAVLFNLSFAFVLLDLAIAFLIFPDHSFLITILKYIISLFSILIVLYSFLMIFKALFLNTFEIPFAAKEGDLLLYSFGNVFGFTLIKAFYVIFSDQNTTITKYLNLYLLCVIVFVLISLFAFSIDFLKRLQEDRTARLLDLKIYFVRYAIIGPLLSIMSIYIFLYIININDNLKIELMFSLFPFIVVILMGGVILDYHHNYVAIIFWKSSMDEETDKYIENLYRDQTKVQDYYNSKLKVAGIINVIDTVILLPIILFILLF